MPIIIYFKTFTKLFTNAGNNMDPLNINQNPPQNVKYNNNNIFT